MIGINDIRKICSLENLQITLHAAKRLEQRGISIDDVISCILSGEIIEQYPDDYPLPSCLILGSTQIGVPLHVVIGTDMETIWIITAYYPDADSWSSDLKHRR